MKQFSLFVMTFSLVACGGSVESVGSTGTPDPGASGSAGAAGVTSGTGGESASGGQAGQAGSSGTGGTINIGGSAGESGSSGIGGSLVDGGAGAAGAGGDAGASGNAGEAGSAGTGGLPLINVTVALDEDNTPKSAIVTPDGAWHPFASYVASNDMETEQTLRTVTVGLSPGIAAVRVVFNGNEYGTYLDGVQPTPASADLELDAFGTLTIPASTPAGLDFFAKMRSPVPTSIPDDGTNKPPRSGDRPLITLTKLTTLEGKAILIPMLPNPMVLRKSYPDIAKKPAGSVLANGPVELYSWTAAPHTGSVAILQYAFDMTMSTGAKLCTFGLWNGASQVTVAGIWGHPTYTDLVQGCLTQSGQVAVMFGNEEVLQGSTDYALKATASDIVPGAMVTTRFVTAGETVTDDILYGCGGSLVAHFSDPGLKLPGVMWSDLSEVPHTGPVCPSGSSKDWIGDALLQDLTLLHTLVQ